MLGKIICSVPFKITLNGTEHSTFRLKVKYEHETVKYLISHDEYGLTRTLYGVLHREDDPAVEYPNGNEEWLIDGLYHRLDGPALVSSKIAADEWWVDSDILTTFNFNEKKNRYPTLSDKFLVCHI